MIATGLRASLTLRVRSHDDTLCPDNGGGSGAGYSRLIWLAQLGGPFHLGDWIGLAAPSVRLSDQRRVRCTLPRQRLCECIYTQLSSGCQGSDCTTRLLPDSCNVKERNRTKRGRCLAAERPVPSYLVDACPMSLGLLTLDCTIAPAANVSPPSVGVASPV